MGYCILRDPGAVHRDFSSDPTDGPQVHEDGVIVKMSRVPDRIRTYDLPNTGRALYSLGSTENSWRAKDRKSLSPYRSLSQVNQERMI